MYVKRNTEAPSRNNCCRGKVSITYSECISVALIILYIVWRCGSMLPHLHTIYNGVIIPKVLTEL